MIRTKSISDPKEKDDGRRILITRHYPRFCKKLDYDEWDRKLAPTKDLLKKYRNGGLSWKQFTSKFLKELKTPEAKEDIQRVSELGKKANVTLLCYEKEGENCHRQIVKKVLSKRRGQKKKEKSTPTSRRNKTKLF